LPLPFPGAALRRNSHNAEPIILVCFLTEATQFGGKTKPDGFPSMSMTALLPLGLAFLMFVVGLRLTADDFLNLWRQPRAVFVGLAAQVLGLPLLALLIARLLSLPPHMALGLLVVAAAPGGITSNFMTLLARGDVALSTTMTLGTSLIAGVTIPAVLHLGGAPLDGDAGLAVAVTQSVVKLMTVSAVPMLIGMAIRRFLPGATMRWGAVIDHLATVVFFIIVAGTFIQNGPGLIANAATAGPASVLLNVGAIALSFAVGGLTRLPGRQSLAIAIECGLQNVVMAIFICTNILHADDLVVPALVYAVVMNVTALFLVWLGRTRIAIAAAA
jgi:BASS family bile acid:Na+ symporter